MEWFLRMEAHPHPDFIGFFDLWSDEYKEEFEVEDC